MSYYPPPPPPPFPSHSSSSSLHIMTETAPPPSLPPAPYLGRDTFSRHLQGPIQLPPLNIPQLAGRDYPSPHQLQPLPPIQTGSSNLNQPRSYAGPVAPLNQILSSDPYHPPRSDAVHSPYGAVTPPRSAVDSLHPLRQERTIHELQRSARQEPSYLPQVDSSVRPPPHPANSSPSFASRHGSVNEPYRMGSLGSVQSSHSSHGNAPYPESAVVPAPPRPATNQGRPAPGPTMNENFTYELRVRQQPIAARACGFGERDRRVIDPPPIIELRITDPATGKPVGEELKYSLNVVHCTLWSADGTVDQTALEQPDRRTTRRLMGQLVASPSVAKDEHDVEGCFFCFPDLSCRTHGKYRLKFVLMKIVPEQMVIGGYSPIITEVLSDVFTVYTAKDFPGMRPSSALTRALKLQGCNIQVKKGNEKILARKRPTPSDDDDDDDIKEKRRR